MKRKEIEPTEVARGEAIAASGSDTRATAKKLLGAFHCGCAGFSNSNWVGNFYPKTLVGHDSERQLDHYQQHFNSVEINGTFYGLPTDSTISKWKRHAAPTFQYVLKAKKTITHEDQTELNVVELEIFLQRAKMLSDQVVVLVQCPQSLTVTTSQLHSVSNMVKRTEYKGRLAFEFRNPTTYNSQDIRTFLSRQNWALVYHPNSVGRYTKGTSVSGRGDNTLGSSSRDQYSLQHLSAMASSLQPTADFVYVRLHGSNDEHRYDYSPTQLDNIASQIHCWRQEGLSVFCFLLNDLEPAAKPGKNSTNATLACETWAAMPKNAHQLMERVYGLAQEPIPKAPKQPQNTITSFFSAKKTKTS